MEEQEAKYNFWYGLGKSRGLKDASENLLKDAAAYFIRSADVEARLLKAKGKELADLSESIDKKTRKEYEENKTGSAADEDV